MIETVEITNMHRWNGKLFSFRISRPASFRFEAGQFCRIGMEINGKQVLRPYSIVSSPYEDYLEFYSIVAPGGALTPPLNECNVGDEILFETKAHGYLTMGSRFVEGGRDLWMLATGTGLAPFMSMLQDPYTYEKFENIILVHCVRNETELAYRKILEGALFDQEHLLDFEKMFKYVPVVTQQLTSLKNRRIPALLEDNTLDINTDSRVMICGNPQMVKDTRAILEEKGLKIGTLKVPGEIIIENAF